VGAVFVGENVCLREPSSVCAEPRSQLVEEAQVDVDVLATRQQKGPTSV
jgi:hypothetical protein